MSIRERENVGKHIMFEKHIEKVDVSRKKIKKIIGGA